MARSPKPPAIKTVTSKPSYHKHACTKCHLWYADFCDQQHTDGQCLGCRGKRVWQLLIDNAAPRDCCKAFGENASKDDCKAYGLVGKHTWVQCRKCRRTWTREWQTEERRKGNWT